MSFYKIYLNLSLILLIIVFNCDLQAQTYLSEAKNIIKPSYTLKETSSTEKKLFLQQEEENSANAELKLYPHALDKNSTLLLHLKYPASSVQLFIVNMFGRTVSIPIEGNLKSGFYEVSVLSKQASPGIYTARLIIDGKVYSRHIVR